MKRPYGTVRNLAHGHGDDERQRTWYTVRNAAGEGGQPAEVWIYDEIGYWGVTSSAFASELRDITASEISVRLNSPGGDVFEGIAIHNALRRHPANVTVYVDALAASAASFIMQAADTIKIDKSAQVMIHDAIGFMFGNAATARELADQLDRASDTIANIYAERSGVDAQFWRSEMQREVWYNAAEAVEAGLADEIDEPRARMRNRVPVGVPRNAAWDLSVYQYAGRDKAPAPRIPARTRAGAGGLITAVQWPDTTDVDPLVNLLAMYHKLDTASTVDAASDPLAALRGA